MKTNIAVLISGSGTNLQSIIDKTASGYLPANIRCVISDREDAYGLERARKHHVPAYFIDPKKYETRPAHEEALMAVLQEHDVELVVLAGYMRILTKHIIDRYRNRIMNIHPALLPSFPGTDGYGDAWRRGVKVGGCTVHFVNEGCDTGPIIMQEVNFIKPDDTFESFKARGLEIEHRVLPEAIKLYCEKRLVVEGCAVKILSGR
ncbi:MAG: phosphoribosylglycinamide formyltransferase [Spirochaetes bacterium RBG_16_49_21]|nr:MAG: phosphoribosylglycinamide formyltransferase [Spirochaetes bacterium RBG_16_49_21]